MNVIFNYILALLVVFISTSCMTKESKIDLRSAEDRKYCNDINGVLYYKGSPYSGVATWPGDHSGFCVMRYSEGILDGTSKCYLDSNTVASIENYTGGVANGSFTQYDECGWKFFEGEYSNGQLIGNVILYYGCPLFAATEFASQEDELEEFEKNEESSNNNGTQEHKLMEGTLNTNDNGSTWRVFDEKGKLNWELVYDNQELQQAIRYKLNGDTILINSDAILNYSTKMFNGYYIFNNEERSTIENMIDTASWLSPAPYLRELKWGLELIIY